MDLDAIPDTGSLFEPNRGRVVPGWLEPLVPTEQSTRTNAYVSVAPSR